MDLATKIAEYHTIVELTPSSNIRPTWPPLIHQQRLTTERVLTKIERVIQSNHEFGLNETVNVNLVHVEMPSSVKSAKRNEINFEKHLAKSIYLFEFKTQTKFVWPVHSFFLLPKLKIIS